MTLFSTYGLAPLHLSQRRKWKVSQDMASPMANPMEASLGEGRDTTEGHSGMVWQATAQATPTSRASMIPAARCPRSPPMPSPPYLSVWVMMVGRMLHTEG